MSKGRKRVLFVIDGPSSAQPQYVAPSGARVKHSGLDFDDGPDHSDLDERERRKLLAMMLAAKDRASRPWCDICNKHKVSRVGKGIDAPLDTMCNACGRASIEHGPKHAFEHHDEFCNTCGKRKIKRAGDEENNK